MATACVIEKDIRTAQTLPGSFYSDAEIHQQLMQVFARSWLFVGDEDDVRTPGMAHPVLLLPSFLDEPLLLSRDSEDRLHCLSNVCTHRGMLVAEAPCRTKTLRCRYHGRRFSLDGRCLGMPEFDQVVGFPSPSDDLPRLQLGRWANLLFSGLEPDFPFAHLVAPLEERLVGLPLERQRHTPDLSRDYHVQANWALYCDNYLESFHVPFAHPSLAKTLDYKRTEVELFPHGSLQVGFASRGEAAFTLPKSSIYHGRDVAALYFHLFPNTMLNFYPWGLSLNLVEPIAIDRTRVRFRAYVHTPEKLDSGAGADLDRVEREDEAIVEAAQLGTGSRLYRFGRYSPTQEQAVHHFHRLLVARLGGGSAG